MRLVRHVTLDRPKALTGLDRGTTSPYRTKMDVTAVEATPHVTQQCDTVLDGYEEWSADVTARLDAAEAVQAWPFYVEQRFHRGGLWVTQVAAMCPTQADAQQTMTMLRESHGPAYHWAVRRSDGDPVRIQPTPGEQLAVLSEGHGLGTGIYA